MACLSVHRGSPNKRKEGRKEGGREGRREGGKGCRMSIDLYIIICLCWHRPEGCVRRRKRGRKGGKGGGRGMGRGE